MAEIMPLSDLEMVELLQAAYPERFPDDSNETWDAAMDFAEDLNGFDELADLLGRVATLTMPTSSPLSGALAHVLGTVTIKEDTAHMVAAVKRSVV